MRVLALYVLAARRADGRRQEWFGEAEQRHAVVDGVDKGGAAGKGPASHVSRYRPVNQVAVNSVAPTDRSEEHTSELQSLTNLVCRLLLEKKKQKIRLPPRESQQATHRRAKLN